MSDPFIAEIRPFGFGFAPRGWATCDGQLLPIQQYQALFSLVGTTYGGDGRTTFGLPDLRGRVPVHRGDSVKLGQKDGAEYVTLSVNEMPAHSHLTDASTNAATTNVAAGAVLADPGSGNNLYGAGANLVGMPGNTTGDTGGGQSHDNMQPYLTINYCICLEGFFPSRN